MSNDEFKELCENVADECDVELIDLYDDGDAVRDDVYEDDGTLHVVRNGFRAAFDVSENQNLSADRQNAITALVLQKLGIKVTHRALAH